MKNLLLMPFFLLLSVALNAQKNFQGQATYETKTSTSDIKKQLEGNKNITPEMQKTFEDNMKKIFEKTFILNFDTQASIYKEEEKLDDPTSQGGGMRLMSNMLGGGGTYYKNIKEKSYANDKEFMGKEFLITDTLTNYKWKLELETRIIGGYNCYKATTTQKPSASDFRNFRLKKQDEQAKTVDKKSDLLSAIEVPNLIYITAWYTTEIPVNQGPEGYWGLPGLILEVNDGKTTILCSKVILNPKEKVEIKAPNKGEKISQAKYDQTIIKKMEEFREMNRGQGNQGQRSMRFGG